MKIQPNPIHNEDELYVCECLSCIQLRVDELDYYDKWKSKYYNYAVFNEYGAQRFDYQTFLTLFKNRKRKKLKKAYAYGRPYSFITYLFE